MTTATNTLGTSRPTPSHTPQFWLDLSLPSGRYAVSYERAAWMYSMAIRQKNLNLVALLGSSLRIVSNQDPKPALPDATYTH